MSISNISGSAAYQARSSASSQSCQHNQSSASSSSSKRSPSSESSTVDFSALAMMLQQSEQSGTQGTSQSSSLLSGVGSAGSAGSAPTPPPRGMDRAGGPPPSEEMDQALSDLSSALESGDIDAAKEAFANLQSLAPPPPPDETGVTATTDTGSSETSSSFSDMLAALSNALDSGDTTAAQSAYDSLIEDIEAHKPNEEDTQQRQQSTNHYRQMALMGSNWSNNASTISTSA